MNRQKDLGNEQFDIIRENSKYVIVKMGYNSSLANYKKYNF